MTTQQVVSTNGPSLTAVTNNAPQPVTTTVNASLFLNHQSSKPSPGQVIGFHARAAVVWSTAV